MGCKIEEIERRERWVCIGWFFEMNILCGAL